MTIYEKLNEARVQFQSRKIKMSGKNKFAGYEYYELSDILPAINQIAKEIGFTCIVTFNNETAKMAIVDTAKPEDKIFFTSPMSSAELKGCHSVQNLGAVETYLRRYLYQTAFEIVESDGLNATHNLDAKPTPKPEQEEDKEGKAKLIAEIGKVMTVQDSNKKDVFSAAEKEEARKIILSTGAWPQGIENLNKLLDKQKKILAERLDKDFKDDLPDEPKKEEEIF